MQTMRTPLLFVLLASSLFVHAQKNGVRPSDGDISAVDYRVADHWLCRPGQNSELCTGDLEAVRVDASGKRAPAASKEAPIPKPIDCFYVYPTASGDATFYSGLHREKWVDAAVHEQAARLSSVCRLFAPFYHQVSSTGLHWQIQHGALEPQGRDATLALMQGIPYRDVLAAWRDYLQHENHGRGVVLVGHSQGAIIFKKLIAEEIEGKPAGALLVAAYLAGNPVLGTEDFQFLKPCHDRTQTGCLVAWSSYAAEYTGHRFFGAAIKGQPICVNPAMPQGGAAPLDTFLPRRMDPSAAPAAFSERTGQFTGSCVQDVNGAVLRIHTAPGTEASTARTELKQDAADGPEVFGYHFSDFILTEGNVVDLIRSQSAAFLALHPNAAN